MSAYVIQFVDPEEERPRIKSNMLGEIRATCRALRRPELNEHMTLFTNRLARCIEQARENGATDEEIGRAFTIGLLAQTTAKRTR